MAAHSFELFEQLFGQTERWFGDYFNYENEKLQDQTVTKKKREKMEERVEKMMQKKQKFKVDVVDYLGEKTRGFLTLQEDGWVDLKYKNETLVDCKKGELICQCRKEGQMLVSSADKMIDLNIEDENDFWFIYKYLI